MIATGLFSNAPSLSETTILGLRNAPVRLPFFLRPPEVQKLSLKLALLAAIFLVIRYQCCDEEPGFANDIAVITGQIPVLHDHAEHAPGVVHRHRPHPEDDAR